MPPNYTTTSAFADALQHPKESAINGTGQRAATEIRMADEKTEKGQAIDLALAQIEKQFGKGSIMRLGNKEAIVAISVISTASISFGAALGVGGFPRVRGVEVFAPES